MLCYQPHPLTMELRVQSQSPSCSHVLWKERHATQVSRQLWRPVGWRWVVFHQITPIEALLPTPGGGTERWVFPHKLSAAYIRTLKFPRDLSKKITVKFQGFYQGQASQPACTWWCIDHVEPDSISQIEWMNFNQYLKGSLRSEM